MIYYTEFVARVSNFNTNSLTQYREYEVASAGHRCVCMCLWVEIWCPFSWAQVQVLKQNFSIIKVEFFSNAFFMQSATAKVIRHILLHQWPDAAFP